MGHVAARRRITRIGPAERREGPDTLAVEEPLEIRLSGRPFTVTMRTPGDDFDLVAGFLHGEGVIASAEDVPMMRCCTRDGSAADGATTFNVVDVTLAEGVTLPPSRPFSVTSACGVCGKTSIDELRQRARYPVAGDPVRLSPGLLSGLPAKLRAAQRVFERTGGLHAAGLFDASGALTVVREDVGRHNAVDKVVGWALREGRLPLTGHILMLSGRASFELTQKAMLAGIPVIAAVSAPSSLAADLADETGMTLIGFLRGDSMNVYATPERVT